MNIYKGYGIYRGIQRATNRKLSKHKYPIKPSSYNSFLDLSGQIKRFLHILDAEVAQINGGISI